MPSSIDWARPWYAAVRSSAEKIIAHDWVERRASLNQLAAMAALTNHRGLPLRFVAHSALPEGMAYESFISESGQVPTRDNLHDYFNALVWLSFPHIKRQLNALQAAQIASVGIGRSRGATRDAATIFDENAALLVVSDMLPGHALADALRQHHWQQAFLEQRASFDVHAQVWLFGHALLEKLVKPYKAITAHLWVVTAPQTFFLMTHQAQRDWLDAELANVLQQLAPAAFTTRCFSPLPVLGVPGWAASQGPAFYADAQVFRLPHRRAGKSPQ